MNFSATFIRKPIATALLMAAILLLGLISYELLPVAALPNIDTPMVKVTARFCDIRDSRLLLYNLTSEPISAVANTCWGL
jgi:hypothetical protein